LNRKKNKDYVQRTRSNNERYYEYEVATVQQPQQQQKQQQKQQVQEQQQEHQL